MARKIYITSDMSIDERLMSLANEKAALMWPWILLALDDWGRGDASPRRLKAQIFPMLTSLSITDIAEALSSYDSAGLIMLYEDSGKHCMAVPPVKWFRYQTHVRTEKRSNDAESHFPAPPIPATLEPDSGAKNTPARNGAHSRASARKIALHHTTPPPFTTPSLPPTTTPPQREVARNGTGPASPGLVGGVFDKSRGVLVGEGISEATVDRAIEEICQHPPTQKVRSPLALLRTVITRQIEQLGAQPATPAEIDAREQAEWEAQQSRRRAMEADIEAKLTPEQRAAAEVRRGKTVEILRLRSVAQNGSEEEKRAAQNRIRELISD